MRRLILGFAGRTYHIVENIMHWLINSLGNLVYYGIEVLTLLKLSFKANVNFTLKIGKGQP